MLGGLEPQMQDWGNLAQKKKKVAKKMAAKVYNNNSKTWHETTQQETKLWQRLGRNNRI